MIPLGVEYGCKFTLERANGWRAVFNDSTDADYVGVLDPTQCSGLDAPEIREDAAEKVENDGAIFGDFFAGKRPVVLGGSINATSTTSRNERASKLRRVTNAKRDDLTLTWEPQGTGQKVFMNMRRGQPLRVTEGFLKKFQASLVAADSRILSSTLQVVSAKGLSASSQEKSPTASGEVGTGTAWTNVGNIKASDNVYATVALTSGAINKFIFGKTYGFTIPNTALIIGVEVKPEAKANSAAAIYGQIARISRNIESITTTEEDGPLAGVKRASTDPNFALTALGTSDAVQTIGSALDLWNYAKFLTPTNINSANFGAGIFYQNLVIGTVTASMDYLPIKITYAEPIAVEAKNEGDAPAPALIKIKGPLENFYILNQANEEMLRYSGVLESGKELWFDTQNVTVTERGTGITVPINRFGNVSFPNDWINVEPGTNKILLAGPGGSGSTELKVEWRHAWE